MDPAVAIVVQDDAVPVADDAHDLVDLDRVVVLAPLRSRRHADAQHPRERVGLLRVTEVGRDHDRPRDRAHEMRGQHGERAQVIHGHGEEPVYLLGVERHRPGREARRWRSGRRRGVRRWEYGASFLSERAYA